MNQPANTTMYYLHGYTLVQVSAERLCFCCYAGDDIGFVWGDSFIKDDVLFLVSWRWGQHCPYEPGTADLPPWRGTTFYAECAPAGWRGVRRCDTNERDEAKTRQVEAPFRKADHARIARSAKLSSN